MSDCMLVYVGDPMCSWCYGFGPRLDALLAMQRRAEAGPMAAALSRALVSAG